MTTPLLRVAWFAFALAATSPAPDAAENVLRWASVGGALTADPQAYDEGGTTAQLSQVYEVLVGLDSNLELVPGLATSWRLVDPTTWEFALRPNVRFHDGTPFTAADVVFSIARARTELPAGFASRTESIADVQAIDEHTVRIVTKFPAPQLYDNLRTIRIMSKQWADAHDAGVPLNPSVGEENYASRHANGTGPFVLTEFELNGPLIMIRNPEWWGFGRYPHNIDRIEYTPIAEPEQRLAALLRGDLDLLTDPPPTALDRIKSAPGLKLAQVPDLFTIYLGLDQGRAELRSSDIKGRNPFGDKRVRDLPGDRHRGDSRDGHAGPIGPGGDDGPTRREWLCAGARQAVALRPRDRQSPACSGRLPAWLRRDARLPEQSLHQRRGCLPGDCRKAGRDRH